MLSFSKISETKKHCIYKQIVCLLLNLKGPCQDEYNFYFKFVKRCFIVPLPFFLKESGGIYQRDIQLLSRWKTNNAMAKNDERRQFKKQNKENYKLSKTNLSKIWGWSYCTCRSCHVARVNTYVDEKFQSVISDSIERGRYVEWEHMSVIIYRCSAYCSYIYILFRW